MQSHLMQQLAGLWEPTPVALGGWQFIVTAAVAVLLTAPGRVWRVTGLYSTLIHELGHILAGLLTGRFIMGLRLGWDHSGEVKSRGRGKFSVIFSGIFGYPFPVIVSALLLWAVSADYAGRALLLYALLFLAALIFVRNWTALVVCLASAVGSLAVVWWSTPELSVMLALLLAGFLLLAGLRDYVKLLSVHLWRRGDLGQSDAYLIAQATGTFATLWLLTMLAVGFGAVWLALRSVLELVPTI